MRKFGSAMIYAVTGALTGYQVLILLMWGIGGAPTSWTQYVSIFGSVLMFISAGVSFKSQQLSDRLAIFAAALQWIFYAPALGYTSWTFWRTSTDNLVAIIPPIGLAVASALSFSGVRKSLQLTA